MKKIFLIIAGILFSGAVIAQIPQLFKYQGLARGIDGNPVSNTTISLRISIHQATPNGTVVYRETHSPLTNEFGSFSVNIGAGTVVTGIFSTIPWGRNNYFQEVEMDITGGSSFVSMGTSQYLSVPYALSSDSARFGTAPFWVQNNVSGNDTASVAIFAFANNGAAAIFCKNVGSGRSVSIHAESGNGKYFEGDSSGLTTNGNLNTNGITLNGLAGTPGQILGIGSGGNLAWLPSPGFSNFQVFNSSGTFTVPGRTIKIMVEVWGAGGAGSGTSGTGNGGNGGGAGGYGKEIFSVLPGALFPLIIGAGGTGVVDGNGNPGGGSSFDVLMSASGGNGALRGTGGGLGGSSTASFNVNGGSGENGSNGNFPGAGGAAGGGGGSGQPGGGGQGISPGGGGSGTGVNGTAGGNGALGRVVVWW